MAKGLDIGTGGICSAYMEGDEINFRRIRNVFVELDLNPVTKMMLKKSNVPTVLSATGKTLAVGDKALELASAFNVLPKRPMKRGVIDPSEISALPVLKVIIKELLGEPEEPGEKVFFSVPASPVDQQFDAIYHEGVFGKLLGELGYTGQSINEGLTVIYSELLEENLTGIGISLGAGMANVCCAVMGAPLFSFSVAASGDFIDTSVATALGISSVKAMRAKETMDLMNPKDQTEEAIGHYTKALHGYVLDNITRAYEALEKKPDIEGNLKVAVAGGTSMPTGFMELFEKTMKARGGFLADAEVIHAGDPLTSIANGALFACLVED
jgi:hypothetical protein